MKAKRNRGPYTLPLPTHDGRPQWLKQGYAHHRGKKVTPDWALRYPKIKHYRQEKAEMPETLNERTGLPVRSGGIQAWDHDKQRWVACPNRATIRRYAKGAV